jgi:hypothetical protein
MSLARRWAIPPGPKKGGAILLPQKVVLQGQLPKGGVGLCPYSLREDWYSGNVGDIGGVERALAVYIFGRGFRGLERPPAVCIFGRAFPPKERAALRAAPSQVCETGSRVDSLECEMGLYAARGSE